MTCSSSRMAYVLIGLGFLFRCIYIFAFQPMDSAIFSDMQNYVTIADLIGMDEWRASHFFQPIGFPYVILFFKKFTSHWITWLECFHVLLSTGTLIVLWKTCEESLGKPIAFVVLAISAIHLPWISLAGLAIAETLFIFLLSLLSFLTLKILREKKTIYFILWGLIFFLAFLTKGTHVFLGPIFLIALWIMKKTKIRNLILVSLIVGIGLLSHGLFSQSKIGKFNMTATAGGLNFVEGKCPIKNNADNAGYSWLSPLYFQLDMHEMKKWDRPFSDSSFFMKEGFKCILKKPSVLLQSLEGIPFLFIGNTLWPPNQLKISNWLRLYELFFGIFTIFGLIVFTKFLRGSVNWEEEFIMYCLPVISIFICVYIFKSEIRFRIPFDVWIIPISVKGWIQFLNAKVKS